MVLPPLARPLPAAWCRYGLEALRMECLRVLAASITIDNATAYALLAHEHSCAQLMQVLIHKGCHQSVHPASSCAVVIAPRAIAPYLT